MVIGLFEQPYRWRITLVAIKASDEVYRYIHRVRVYASVYICCLRLVSGAKVSKRAEVVATSNIPKGSMHFLSRQTYLCLTLVQARVLMLPSSTLIR